ncbi:hypothetical protein RND81_10G090300 [Saponaria officinalis]|uniref:Uncharacterized protein n=1 Tax=Saponaria officinalis TaxID=3572 RepID=A0AAW1I0T7_SAPOF
MVSWCSKSQPLDKQNKGLRLDLLILKKKKTTKIKSTIPSQKKASGKTNSCSIQNLYNVKNLKIWGKNILSTTITYPFQKLTINFSITIRFHQLFTPITCSESKIRFL